MFLMAELLFHTCSVEEDGANCPPRACVLTDILYLVITSVASWQARARAGT